MSLFVIVILTQLTATKTFAQEVSPSLSFGLDQVLFGKGIIDVELLTRIIEEKQDELKKRVIEQAVLEPIFKETSFATKNYVFSVVHDLLNEKDKNVIKKNVMEQTVNYAVIYSIAEMYVQLNWENILKDPNLIVPTRLSIDMKNPYTSKLFTAHEITIKSKLIKDVVPIEKKICKPEKETEAIFKRSSILTNTDSLVVTNRGKNDLKIILNATSAGEIFISDTLKKNLLVGKGDTIGILKRGNTIKLKSSGIGCYSLKIVSKMNDTINLKFEKLDTSIVLQKDSLSIFFTKDTLVELSKEQRVNYNSFLMDCILQAILENRNFQDRGFLKQQFYFDLDQFKNQSFYHNLEDTEIKKELYNEVFKFVQDISDWYESFETLSKVFLENKTSDKPDSSLITDFKKTLYNNMRITQEKVKAFSKVVSDDEYKRAIDGLNQAQYITNEENRLLSESKEQMTNLSKRIKYKVLSNSKEKNLGDTIDRLKKSLEKTSGDLDSIRKTEIHLTSYFQMHDINQYYALVNKTGNKNSKDSVVIKYFDLKSDSSLLNHTITQLTKIEQSLELLKVNIKLEVQKIELEKIQREYLAQEAEQKAIETYGVIEVLNLLERELKIVSNSDTLYTGMEYDSLINTLFKSYYFVRYNPSKAKNLEYIHWMREKLIPSLAFLNLKTHGKLDKVLTTVDFLSYKLETDVYKKIDAVFNGKDSVYLSLPFKEIFKNPDVSLIQHLKFFEKLDQLNKVETYYYLLEQLKVAGEQSPKRNVANAISLITQSIEKHTSFNEANEHIEVDVESIILKLVERYGERDHSRCNFHLTLGLNNAFSFNSNALVDGNGTSIRNLGYASEKIGMRYNLYNGKLKYSYLEGELKPKKIKSDFDATQNYKATPLVSNVHLVAYGSGLLYQLSDLGTTKDLKATFVGLGAGITFYNNLNFNVSAMLPIKYSGSTRFEHTVLNVGFDIYFTEYISALNKKRKENKDQKMQLEYMKYSYDKAVKPQTQAKN